MAKRIKSQNFRFKGQRSKPASRIFHLETTSNNLIKLTKKKRDQLLKYKWDLYNELFYQRDKYKEEIFAALNSASIKWETKENWVRLVGYKYTNTPLSSRGSIIQSGRRFNVGNINESKFNPFRALYIASNKETAECEYFQIEPSARQKLTPSEFSLRNNNSFSTIMITGNINSIISLRNKEKITPFVEVLKKIKIPKALTSIAIEIGWEPEHTISTTDEFLDSMLAPNWNVDPMNFDVPANSQLFGQLVLMSGIEGILYPSKFTGKDCLVIFPDNLEKSESYIEINGEIPENISFKRLDSTTCRKN